MSAAVGGEGSGRLDTVEEVGSCSSTGSESGSTEEEDRLRRLFQACDRDGDGFIDRQDLAYMCEQLGLEECCAEDIMTQLGADSHALISFEEFALCRQRLMTDIEQEKLHNQPAKEHNHAFPQPGAVLSLFELLEEQDATLLPGIVQLATATQGSLGHNFLDTLNSLHMVALSACHHDMVELSDRLRHVIAEKTAADRLITRLQADKSRLAEESVSQLEHAASSHEQRVVELHSVIAELQRKLERHQIGVIQEEDAEYEELDEPGASNEPSINENNPNDSRAPSIAEIGEELNAELNKVVQQLETAIRENQESRQRNTAATATTAADDTPAHSADIHTDDTMADKHKHMDLKMPPLQQQLSRQQLEQQMQQLRGENSCLHEQMGKQETDLHKLRAQLGSLSEERDRLRQKVRELQGHINNMETAKTPTQALSPTKLRSDLMPVTKMAELKKLKTGASDRPITGAEITSVGLPNAKVAEHLSQSVQDSSSVQEALSEALSSLQAYVPNAKIQEFEIEVERSQSKIEHLRAQNDVLCLTLEESKGLCARLTVLLGKHESNSTALSLAACASDAALEVADILNALTRAQLASLLAQCRAAGLASIADDVGGSVQRGEDMAQLLQRVQQTRQAVQHQAKQLLLRLDHRGTTSCQHKHRPATGSPAPQPWEDLSSCCNSHTTRSTTSTSTSNSAGGEDLTGSDIELRLREHLHRLKAEKQAVIVTTSQLLESVHLDPLLPPSASSPHLDAGDLPDTAATAQRLDLENAVLMQELMAIKEEKAELKASNYLLLNEKAALELKLSGKESQEKAYLVTIEHLKSEVSCEMEPDEEGQGEATRDKGATDGESKFVTPSITLEELRFGEGTPGDLAEAARREKKLRAQVTELVNTLEKLSRNSEHRHQQSAEFVNDLKRANSALVAAYEKSKKKYMARIRKLEEETAALQKLLSQQQLNSDPKKSTSHRPAFHIPHHPSTASTSTSRPPPPPPILSPRATTPTHPHGNTPTHNTSLSQSLSANLRETSQKSAGSPLRGSPVAVAPVFVSSAQHMRIAPTTTTAAAAAAAATSSNTRTTPASPQDNKSSLYNPLSPSTQYSRDPTGSSIHQRDSSLSTAHPPPPPTRDKPVIYPLPTTVQHHHHQQRNAAPPSYLPVNPLEHQHVTATGAAARMRIPTTPHSETSL